ncbi:MAG: hypothetical protein WA437_17000 [Candidatus Sulfotelmatobacter sp.]
MVIVKVVVWLIAPVPLVDAATVTMLAWGEVIRPVALLLLPHEVSAANISKRAAR